MATPPLPLAAAQVLRRHVWRKVRIVALISALGVAGIGVDGAELKETAVLLQRGVSTQAMVTDKERLEDLWTLLTVEFPGGSDLPEVAVVLHEGDVTAKHVQIVYDPLDPATAQLEGDLQPGMLAVEVVLGGVMFILSDGDPLGRFPFAGAGLLLVLAALVMLLRVLRYRYRLLGIAGQPPGGQELRMWLRTDGGKDPDALLERPDDGAATWLRVELLAHQDVEGLTEPGSTVQVLGKLAARRPWLILRTPDGRLLLPKAVASGVASAEVNVQGLERRTHSPQAVETVGAPSLSCLLYLAAERVMPTHADWRLGRLSLSSGISVPCRHARVNKHILVSKILAAAFLDLRDSGRIALDVITKSTDRLNLRDQSPRLSVVLLDPTERPGLPGMVLRATQPYGDRVEAIHQRMFGASNRDHRDSREPSWYSPKAELAELGYALDDCERLVELHDACERAVTRWREFESTEWLLQQVLESECREATSSSR